MKIAVIDYGIGNVRSMLSAFENQGAHVILTRNKEEILEIRKEEFAEETVR